MKDSYFIPAKQRLRKQFRKYIKRHFKKKLPDVKVLCLPGPEMLEIIEIYDKLGIPRENIYSLEREESIYQRLKRDLPNIYWIDAEKFFKMWEKPFDIVSLDYCATYNDSVDTVLHYIARKRLLNNSGVLFIEFLGAREPAWLMKETLLYGECPSMIMQLADRLGEYAKRQNDETMMLSLVNTRLKEQQQFYANLKQDKMWRFIIYPMLICLMMLDIDKSLEKNEEGRWTDNGLIETSLFLNMQEYRENRWKKLDYSYIPLSVERYKYVSDKGSSMIAFIMIFKKPQTKHEMIESLFNINHAWQGTNTLRSIMDLGRC